VAQRHCTNCGTELGDEARFCPSCGRPVHETAAVSTPEADVFVPPAPQAEEEHRPRISLGQFVVGLLVIIGVLWLLIPTEDGSGGGGGNGGGRDAVDKVKQKDQKAAQQEKPQQEEPRQQQAQNQERQPQQQGGAAQEPEPQQATFSNGTYMVGTDVQPGTYRTREGSPGCYYERLKNFTGGLSCLSRSQL
jgi:hypothetical protein